MAAGASNCWPVAIDYAREHAGDEMLEAYPVDKPERSHDDFMFFGSRSLYERPAFEKSYAGRRHDWSCAAGCARDARRSSSSEMPVVSQLPRIFAFCAANSSSVNTPASLSCPSC